MQFAVYKNNSNKKKKNKLKFDHSQMRKSYFYLILFIQSKFVYKHLFVLNITLTSRIVRCNSKWIFMTVTLV